MPTFIHLRTASGSETVTDQLSGTAVAVAGPSGRVKAAVVSTLTTTRVILTGRKTGRTIIPNSFTPVTGALAALDLNANHFVFEGNVQPGEELELTIVSAAAASTLVGVITY